MFQNRRVDFPLDEAVYMPSCYIFCAKISVVMRKPHVEKLIVC